MLDLEVLAFAFAAIFLAAVVQSLTGFGFGIIAVPLLTLLISPKVVAPIALLNAFTLNVLILRRSYADVDPTRIWPLALAAFAGLPIGTWFLVNSDVLLLRLSIGIATTVFTVLYLFGFRREVTNERLASIPVGFASGLMQGSINMSGPPVILFFTNQRIPRHVFRASIVAYFTLVILAAIPLYVASGILDFDAVANAVVMFPALVLGTVVGVRLIPWVDEGQVRRVTLLIVLAAGITSILTGLQVI
jgi:uncharacterized membrane protein YfcA